MRDEQDFGDEVAAAHAEARTRAIYVRKQLIAMRRKRVIWNRFRMLEWVCQGCGDIVAEVMGTDPYPVVCFRHGETVPLDETGKRSRLTAIRVDATWTFRPIEWPLPDESVTETHIDFYALCSCRNVWLSGPLLYRDLRGGRTKRVLPTDETRRDTSGQNRL